LTLALTLATAGNLSAGVAPVIPPLPGEFVAQLRPTPKPTAPEADESPAAIAERIVTQGKAAGDRLKEKDSGRFTQKTQQEILDDIDKLLKPPPPMGGDGGPPPPPMPMGGTPPPMGGGMPPPMGGGEGGGMPPPQGGGAKPPPMPMGGNGTPQSRGQMRQQQRDREQQAGQPPGAQGQPMPGNGKPMPNEKGGDKATGGERPNPGTYGDGNGAPPPKPALPPDDAATKQVWGHLPDRLRQEMNQYYKEQFMPKYNDMLRQYYGRLAERDKGAKK